MAPLLTQLLHRLRRLSASAAVDSDAVLLSRFARQRDEAAFAALLARHGPLVRNLCRRLLGDSHLAEDAFQATFLVLARKAASVHPEALSAWLYGVAYRVALKVRSGLARRRTVPLPQGEDAPADPHPDPLAQVSARDLLRTLEAEIQRLPAKQRLPVVLCCLEGLSQEEAARRLGCTADAVRGRLARGRQQLQQRLTRRGLVLSAALAAAEATQATTIGAASTGLLDATVQAATAFATGQTIAAGPVSPPAAALAKGVLHTMLLTRLKTTAIVLFVFGLALGAAGYGYGLRNERSKDPAAASDQDSHKPEAKNPVKPADDQAQKGADNSVKGLSARLVIKSKLPLAADEPLQVELVLKNESDQPLRLCTWRRDGSPHLWKGGVLFSFAQDVYKDSPSPEMVANSVVQLKPGESLSLPAKAKITPSPDGKCKVGAEYALGADFAKRYNIDVWVGRIEVEPIILPAVVTAEVRQEALDQQQLQGVWRITNEDSGQKGEKLVISGTTLHVGANDKLLRFFSLQTAQQPRAIDIILMEQPDGQPIGILKGIYTLDGDVWKVCLTAGVARPTAFPTKAAPGELLVLRREKRLRPVGFTEERDYEWRGIFVTEGEGANKQVFLCNPANLDERIELGTQWPETILKHWARYQDKEIKAYSHEEAAEGPVNFYLVLDPTDQAVQNLLFDKGALLSQLPIDLAPAAKAIRSEKGVLLPVTITNRSSQDITATLPHEWHGGEWPATSLHASVTPHDLDEKDSRKAQPFQPVYLAGEDQAAPRTTVIAAGKSLDVVLRMDWPGTGSAPAAPLMDAAGMYRVQVLLVFTAADEPKLKQYVTSPATEVELPLARVKDREQELLRSLGPLPNQDRVQWHLLPLQQQFKIIKCRISKGDVPPVVEFLLQAQEKALLKPEAFRLHLFDADQVRLELPAQDGATEWLEGGSRPEKPDADPHAIAVLPGERFRAYVRLPPEEAWKKAKHAVLGARALPNPNEPVPETRPTKPADSEAILRSLNTEVNILDEKGKEIPMPASVRAAHQISVILERTRNYSFTVSVKGEKTVARVTVQEIPGKERNICREVAPGQWHADLWYGNRVLPLLLSQAFRTGTDGDVRMVIWLNKEEYFELTCTGVPESIYALRVLGLGQPFAAWIDRAVPKNSADVVILDRSVSFPQFPSDKLQPKKMEGAEWNKVIELAQAKYNEKRAELIKRMNGSYIRYGPRNNVKDWSVSRAGDALFVRTSDSDIMFVAIFEVEFRLEKGGWKYQRLYATEWFKGE